MNHDPHLSSGASLLRILGWLLLAVILGALAIVIE